MDDFGKRLKHITQELKDYIETRFELTMLNFGDKLTLVIGKSIRQLIGYAILAIGFVFGMTALAIYLGDVLGKEWAGYAIVASPFVLVGLIFVLAKPRFIALHIQEQILADMLDSLQEDEQVTEEKEQDPKQLQHHANIKKESE